VQSLAPTSALTINEMRELFGLGAIEGGERRVESRNFVDVSIKNDYQMSMSKSSNATNKPDNEDSDIQQT